MIPKILIQVPPDLVASKDQLLQDYPGNEDLFEGDWVRIMVLPSSYSEVWEGSQGSMTSGVSSLTHQVGWQRSGYQVQVDDGRWLQEFLLRQVEQWCVSDPSAVKQVICHDFHKLVTPQDRLQGYRIRIGTLSNIRSSGSYSDGGQMYNTGFSFQFLESSSLATL